MLPSQMCHLLSSLRRPKSRPSSLPRRPNTPFLSMSLSAQVFVSSSVCLFRLSFFLFLFICLLLCVKTPVCCLVCVAFS